MGVIKRQGIKNSIVSYLGVVLGFIGTLFIYPLNKQLYGEIKYLLDSAYIFIPFLTLGSNALITKFHPTFVQVHKTGFVTLIGKLTFYSLCITSLIFLPIKFFLNEFINKLDNPLFGDQYFYVLYALSILLIFHSLLKTMASVNYRIVVPDIIDNIGLKLLFISLVSLSLVSEIEFTHIIISIFSFFILNIIFLYFYNKRLNPIDFSNFDVSETEPKLRKEIISFWAFAGLNVFGTILTYKIDSMMIGNYIDKESITIYTAFLMMAGIISIPSQSFIKIASPIISKEMTDENYLPVKKLYNDLSLNLILMGVFIFGFIWINMPEILSLMSNGEDYRPFKILFVILGISKLFDLSTSVNHQIMTFSKWYKLNLPLLLVTAFINIFANIYLINEYGLMGVALATAFSMFLYNLLKTIIVYKLLKTQPFQIKMIPIGIILLVLLLIPNESLFSYTIASSIIKSSLFVVVFFISIYFSKSSLEFNQFVIKWINKLKRN